MVTVKVNWVIVRLTWLLTRSFSSYIWYDKLAQIKGFFDMNPNWHEYMIRSWPDTMPTLNDTV